MTKKSFKELFPGLKGKEIVFRGMECLAGRNDNHFEEKDIEENCKDNQKILDAINKCSETETTWSPETLEEANKQHWKNHQKLVGAFIELKKELGL